MENDMNSQIDPVQPMVYQFRIQGYLGQHWEDWFEGLTMWLEDNGETLLTGSVVDQAALHGLLRKVRDAGMPLISVMRVQPDQEEESDVKEELKPARPRTVLPTERPGPRSSL